MILIISEYVDYPTTDVIRWIHSFGKEVFFISNREKITLTIQGTDTLIFSVRETTFTLDDISAVWFRRDRMKLNNVSLKDINNSYLRQYHMSSMVRIEEFINYLIMSNIPCLGNPEHINVNKLKVLHIAERLGLSIPKTILSDNHRDVQEYFNDTQYITKLISPLRNIKHGGKAVNFLTFACNEATLPETFSLSLFQERIEKNLEVRVLYLNGEIMSKAIFSQKDKQTKEDYRNYNNEYPNREVPFQLSADLEQKVHSLMTECKLNIGTLDFIVTNNDEFIFLEINPVGQFTDLSYNCNYSVEKKIAQILL